jgi:hypothetical protein
MKTKRTVELRFSVVTPTLADDKGNDIEEMIGN